MMAFSDVTVVLLVCLCSLQALPGTTATPFTYEDIFDPTLRPRSFDGHWIADHEQFVYRDYVTGNLMLYNADTDVETTIVPNTIFTSLATSTYYVSPDLLYVLLPNEIEPHFKYSYSAKYQIYNIDTAALTNFPAAPLTGFHLQYAGWAPTGHALSFAYGNNLYIQETPTSGSFIQLTDDGDEKYIFNGVADWLYEENVFQNYKTHYWSPDSTSLCYATINNTDVPLATWHVYGDNTQLYPSVMEVAFAKSGDISQNGVTEGPFHHVELTCIYDVFNFPTVKVDVPPPAALASQDYYYTRFSWRDNATVLVAWVNRVQNHVYVNLCDIEAAAPCTLNYERTVTGGWVQAPWPDPIFINGGSHYITYLPKAEGTNTNYWNHVAYVDAADGVSNQITYLTTGLDEVASIVGYDSTRHLVYYIATNGDPTERHLFSVGTPEAASADQVVTCLTCDDQSCRVTSASFSYSAAYYIDYCQGPDIDNYWLRHVAGTKTDVELESNADVAALMAQKDMPTRHLIDITLNGNTFKGEYYLPHDHVEGTRYPLFMHSYGGPDVQIVLKTYDAANTRKRWLRYLTSSEKIVVASMDPRGTSQRGEDFRHQVYRRLGTEEVYDYLNAGTYFKSQSYVDTTYDAAIFGWSYGGFVTAHAIANTSNVYQCGLAVAPVTSYRYYDTFYTERYMGLATTDDNSYGYDGTDVIRKVNNFAGKKFYIIHGSGDDNVHFDQSAHLAKALQQADIQFKLMMYIDDGHGLLNSQQHVYRLLSDALLDDCWREYTGPTPTSTPPPPSNASSLGPALWLAGVTLLVSLLRAF